jgi:hypothetical protein
MSIIGGRDPIYRALYTRLKTYCTTVQTFARGMSDYASLEAKMQPALVMNVAEQIPMQRPSMPPVWKLNVDLIILVRDDPYSGDDSKCGDAYLNNIFDQIESALEIQPGESQFKGESRHTTLGGLCQYCWIAEHGIMVMSAGDTSGQALALVPIEMLAAGYK